MIHIDNVSGMIWYTSGYAIIIHYLRQGWPSRAIQKICLKLKSGRQIFVANSLHDLLMVLTKRVTYDEQNNVYWKLKNYLQEELSKNDGIIINVFVSGK